MINSAIEDVKNRFRQGNPIINLIIINVVVHIFLQLVAVFLFLIKLGGSLDEFMRNWFWFPADPLQIPFRFWTVTSYMFLHEDFLHIFFNLLNLYIFGTRLNDWIAKRHIVPIYILGGIVGALFFTIGFNIFPVFDAFRNAGLLGASASVMAIVFAAATINPKATFYIPFVNIGIELKWIALAWGLLNLVVIPGGNPGGALAHLGGAFMGWFYISQLNKGKDLGEPVNYVLNWFYSWKNKGKPQMKKTTSSKKAKAKVKKTPFEPSMNIYYKAEAKSDYYGNEYGHSFMQKYKNTSREECLNMVLEKIKRSGYDGLSEDEKIFLNRYN